MRLLHSLLTKLGINKVKADSVSGVLAWASTSIVSIVTNKALSKEERLNQTKNIAAERDQKIEALLTTVQIQKLKSLMSAYKQKLKDSRGLTTHSN